MESGVNMVSGDLEIVCRYLKIGLCLIIVNVDMNMAYRHVLMFEFFRSPVESHDPL